MHMLDILATGLDIFSLPDVGGVHVTPFLGEGHRGRSATAARGHGPDLAEHWHSALVVLGESSDYTLPFS